ncbi:uncharacterized protein ocm [Calliphora vicina]|uniref:uncharacterized protein ocm n=1 Tax=Calliphora vicina TaxID=7373 RepID=UPI00325BDA0D
MIKLTQNDWRIFRRLQRKHKVSSEFLRYNLENIEKFIWFETWPRIVIKRYAVRKENRVFIIYYRLRRVLFDQSNRKMFKRMRQNIKQWSKRIVAWQKTHLGIKEYVEEVVYEEISEKKDELVAVANTETSGGAIEDVSKQLKEQLKLLKNGRRPQPLITNSVPKETPPSTVQENLKCTDDKEKCPDSSGNKEEKQKSDSNSVDDVRRKLKEQLNSIKARRDNTAPLDIIKPPEPSDRDGHLAECSSIETQQDWQINLESTPEKQITTQENIQPVKQLDTDEKTEKSHTEPSAQQTDKLKTGLNFLDMLMCKVSGSTSNQTIIGNVNSSATKTNDSLARTPSSSSLKEGYQHYHEHSMDSTDEFLGFDDCERIPGMLMTPIVPHSTKNNKNSVFVSESLNEYMRLNDLETNYSIDEDKSVTKSKIFARDMEGLMTPKTKPPHFDMPAVPENLLKFRTVAERKQYLQKFSKNYRLAIINNEASIYRELQRRMRTQKVKSASQIMAQSANSSMSFTRNGWNAASFINTEFNKYYYQVLDVDHGTYKVRLRGVRGNNDEFHKSPYVSRVIKPPKVCPEHCVDDQVWQYLKPIKTIAAKTKKLNRGPLPAVFKPCPLSHKTFQKPLDDDTAALLLAGGSMAVVRMPTVELEVFPEYGKPLHEIAKRYLQYILPHHDISREWAEFSVSTLLQPKSLKEVEQAAAKTFNSLDLRKSYTFVIPYLNDRNHILVRRVVDRSEKLDQSFEQSLEDRELVPKTDFSFRQNIDQTDDVLLTCADVVSDMINTVAISCSENSFIKTDPDGLNIDVDLIGTTKFNYKQNSNSLETRASSSPNVTVAGGNIKKHKKQNSLLMELKRLNATIIDAAVKPGNDKKPCSKEYCQMGCICVSLEDIAPMREHCGKTKCMLECTCKTSGQSRIMRLETDGRTLTTEDAFMLRRKATARLARMEKEFTSTVVLTENETLLINETNNDKKRRCTKAPKRYEDFTDTEDEQRRNSPKKTALTTIDNEKHLAIEIKEVHEPVYVKDSILEQLKHCTVNLVPLQEIDNIAPWCMVHNLYKCFCKGRAVEGKPMIIEKEEVNTTVEHNTEHKLEFDYSVGVKPKYTFDKVEKKNKKTVNYDEDGEDNEDEVAEAEDDSDDEDQDYNNDDDNDDDDWIKEKKRRKRESKDKFSEKQVDEVNINKEQAKSDDDAEEMVDDEYSRDSIQSGRTEKQNHKRSLHEVRKRFYQSRPDSCRRHIPTPRRMFLYCNRRRRLNALKFIKYTENDQSRLLLNEHVMRSVYYHKIDTENHKNNNSSASSTKDNIDAVEKTKCDMTQPPQATGSLSSTDDKPKNKYLLANEVVDLLEDDEEEPSNSKPLEIKDKDENTQLTSSSTRSCSSFEKLSPDTESGESTNHFEICSSGGIITVKKFATLTDLKNTDPVKPTPTAPSVTATNEAAELTEAGLDALKLPKIASCFSLNVKANAQKPTSTAALNKEKCLDFTSATSVHSAAFSQTQNQQEIDSQNKLLLATAPSKEGSTDFPLDMDNENVKVVYNSVIKTMNSLVSRKMQDIDCALQRESHIIPTPNAEILCIMKWCNFLDAFCEGFAYVWQVKIKDETFLVVTIRNMMPLVAGAMGIVNITALKPDKMPLMGKMLLQKFRNKATEKLAVVMQGKQSHWVVKGFLNSDPNMACNKPTPGSHPALTKKINVLCSLLVKQRQKDQKKKEKSSSQWTSPQMNLATQKVSRPTQAPLQQPQLTPKIAQIMPTRRLTTVQPIPPPVAMSQQSLNPPIVQNPILLTQLQQQQPMPQQPLTLEMPPQISVDATQKPIKQNELEPGKVIAKINSRKRKAETAQSNNLLKMDTYSKMSSNIEYRSVTQADINEIFLPELHKLDHKWLVLDLHNDFSHIFVPDFRDLVSLDRIQKVINFARQKSKIVKLQFFQNAPFDAFVTPKSGRKIYFGPLTMDMKSPTLILLQSVDGQMMLRELYQLQHNIVKKPEEKTKAFWLIHLKGKTQFEIDANVNSEKVTLENTLPTSSTAISLITSERDKEIMATSASTTNIVNEEGRNNVDDDDDDEDCMIIDDENVESSPTVAKEVFNFSINSTNTCLPGAPAIQSLISSKANNMDSTIIAPHTQTLLKVPNTNTIIKPLNHSNAIGPVVLNVPPMSVSNTTLPILTLPPNTIITGITPAPSLDVAATPVLNLPTNAVITDIKTAPPEAPYSSTIFITSSASSSSATTTVGTTTSTASISNATSVSNSSDSHQILKNNTVNITRQSFEAGAIKRRRISLFCSKKFDQMSENIAVDAVLRKILPDNTDDILTVREEVNNTTLLTPEVVATVGSTKISKLRPAESNTSQTIMKQSPINSPASTTQPKAPIVFDVNFMDDGDEPTASIVIKPTTTTPATATTTSQTQICKPSTSKTTATNCSLIRQQLMSTKTSTPSTTPTAHVYRNVKLPTLFNTTTAATSSTSTTVSAKGKLINSLLCAKQANVVPKFSTPRPIAPKANRATCSTFVSPTADNSISTTPFPFRRSSVSLKVQKIVSSSVATTLQTAKPITPTAAVTTNQLPPSSPTLTVKQVQEMLNKPGISVASTNNTQTSSAAAAAAAVSSPTMPLQILPSIKARITPAKATPISPATSAIITPASTTSISTACTVSSPSTSVISKTIPNADTASLNPTLTISKVQSFGSPQKPHNPDKNLQKFIPPPSQVVISDVNDKIAPPPHIQYGYIVSKTLSNHKYVAKRVADEFYVKVPSVGILKLQGLGAVNNYLNKYINKTFKDSDNTAGVWQFMAASKAVQMQNHQKSLLVRKTKNPSGTSGTTKNKNNPNIMTVCDTSLDEPILIDD